MARKQESVSIIRQKNEKLIRHSSSEKVSICTQCGKPFEQIYRPEFDNYTSFKMCGICRMINARGGINVAAEYEPHWGQKLVHDSEARFKVLDCGIRWGKDRCSIMEGIKYFIDCLNEDRDATIVPHALWWVIAPVEKIANQNWRELLAGLPREIVVDVSKTTRTIETMNGGIIEVHSAYDPESLVGVGLDFVTITEAARIADLEDVWSNIEGRLNSPGRGLGGKGGHAIINSSPLGQNYFYKMWKWGQRDTNEYDPDWESWRFTTWDNPYMAVRGEQIRKNGRTYKENLKRRMSENRYKQDYEAEFLTDTNVVFGKIDSCFIKTPNHLTTQQEIDEFWKEWEAVDPYDVYTIGYDPAKEVDDAVLLIRNSTGKVVKIDIITRLSWDEQWDRIAFYSKLYNGATVNFGSTGATTIESQLIKRGVPCVPYPEQGRNKERMVEDAALVVSRKLCQIPWSQEAENEFKDYISIRRKSGSTEYRNASNDGHDDIVSAFYFAFADFEVLEDEVLPWTGLIGGVKTKSR